MLRALLPAIAIALAVVPPAFAAEPPPDFNRDVRPILSNTCFKCHGPAVKKSGLRLDSLDFAKKNDAVVPGEPDRSELLLRVCAESDDERMPPPEAGPRLTKAQVDILRRWIAAGAKYDKHWAFAPPQKTEIRGQKPGSGNPIDGFIRARLTAEGMKPSPRADKATLIRRVTLDLIGLLPTPAEVEAFEADASPDAYEKVVSRLLKSPHYGERQARHWLDMARYADSNGYTIDGPRSIWPYRDWVIDALNADMPFDQFTIEQLAGDLVPKPTKEQLTATGFHRNTSFNEEGGTDPEQFRVERTIDRTNTTGAVWLGLTVGCAQCHDHKYDPFSQKDYYRLYAFFNTADEPSLSLGGTPELDKQIADLQGKLAAERKLGNDATSKKLLAEIKKARGKVPSTLVMREQKKPRATHVQIRGDFLRPGDLVTPGYPSEVGATPKGKQTRLDLARWLVSKDNPLTARVVANRAWQHFFGKGLVETENDFGFQGKAPTHPALLDWLAVEFASGPKPWSMKHLHRLIVTSETYKQSSVLTKAAAARDPDNKLLARQSRLRLDAEILRDAALTASGLLTPTVGGPGVYPPLPAELFSFTQSKHPWPESKGPARYRRGLYTFIWRQSQHHLLTTFDAADGQTACTKRPRSNTPLQALHLANDPAFVEFFDAFGKRIEKDGPTDSAGRVTFAFRVALGREPSAKEVAALTAYAASQPAGKQWPAVARVLLNLDEFVTRE